MAGGPAADANVREMLLQRGDTTIVTSEQVRLYVAGGSTIGALGLEDGDALFVPQRAQQRDFQRILQTGSFLFSMLSVILVRF
jgi:hypothetical protein